jgi:hypothetical protein
LPSQWGAIETWNLKHGVPKMSLPVLFAAFKDPFFKSFFHFHPKKYLEYLRLNELLVVSSQDFSSQLAHWCFDPK